MIAKILISPRVNSQVKPPATHITPTRPLSAWLVSLLVILCGVDPVFALPLQDSDYSANWQTMPDSDDQTAAFENITFDLCEKLTKSTERVKVTPVARPPYLRLFREPTFDTKTRRISQSTLGQVVKPAGNPAQAWNIDESLMLLHRYATSGTHEIVLLDGQTYQEIRTLELPYVQSENIYWSHKDPSILYFVTETGAQAGKLTQLDISSNQQIVMKNFAPVCEEAGFDSQAGLLAKPSYDGDFFGYQCGVSNDKSLAITYQFSSDKIHTLPVGKGHSTPAGTPPSPSPDGSHYWLQGSLFDAKLARSEVQLDMADYATAHTLGRNYGNENVVYQATSTGSPGGCNRDLWNGIGLVIEHSMHDASCKPLVNQADNYPTTPQGTDMFASAYASPGWIAMASVGYDNLDYFSGKGFAPLLFSEIYLVNAYNPDDAEICRLAHHRSFGRAAKNASYDTSRGEPNVTVSPMATRVLFASDWYDSGQVDTYVLELPAYTPFNLNGRWVDEYNAYIVTDIVQSGDKISFRRSPIVEPGVRAITTTGTGEISGNKIEVDYVIDVTKNRNVPGQCLATVSSDAANVAFDCRDNYFGRFYTRLVRPQ